MGTNANKVTLADLEAELVSEHYFTAAEAIVATTPIPAGSVVYVYEPLKRLTFCVLCLRNGFTVTGESACVSTENFDAEIGRKIAREHAIEKLWLLLGFRLQDGLHKLAEARAIEARIAEPQTGARQSDCPHAAPFRYCHTCVEDPCPIGLGKQATGPFNPPRPPGHKPFA